MNKLDIDYVISQKELSDLNLLLIDSDLSTDNSYFIYNGERYKLLKVELSAKTGEPGRVLSDNLEIACKDGSIKVLEIQKEGKRQQKINEFMRGSQIKKGSNFNNA